MATYCGQNKGAEKAERIKIGIIKALMITSVWSFIVILMSYTIAPQLIYMVTGSEINEVISTAEKYLKINTIFYFIPGAISILRNAMQGIGDRCNSCYFKLSGTYRKDCCSNFYCSLYSIFWNHYF